jgi:chromosome segregation ATPase
MSEENFDQETEDLQLAGKILELTTFIQGISVKLETLTTNVEKIEKKIEDFDLQLGTKFTEIDEKLKDFDESQKKNEEAIQEIKNSILENNVQIDHNKQEIAKNSSELTQSIEKTTNEISESIESVQEELKTELGSQNQDLNQKIQDQGKSLGDKISSFSDQINSQMENVTNLLDMLGTGMEQLDHVTQTHRDSIDEVRGSIQNFKTKLQEIVTLSKKDQQTHFENFSRILESFNENIRTELTLTTQNLKEADINILNEVSEHYTRKKVGEDLQQSFSNLSEQLQIQTTKTREDLTHNLQKSVEEYEILIENQSGKIQNYKDELERVQGEIQAVIDRKVNEKYEAVFSLLATVALHTEELKMLIKAAEIHIPKEVKVLEKELPSTIEEEE